LEMNHQPMTVLRVIEDGIRTTYPEYNNMSERVEKVVKETELHKGTRPASTEHTIQNGIKQTLKRKLTINPNTVPGIIQDVVENGFKEIKKEPSQRTWMSQQVIENGVKKTYPDKIPHEYDWSDQFTEEIDDIIENGVKHTQGSIFDNPTAVKDTIQNGVKKTKPMDEWVNTKRIIKKTIQEGIKQTKTPGKDGDIVSVTEFMKEHNSNNVPKMIDEIIENGIKKTEGGMLFDESKIDTVISEGIKEVKELPDKSGELRGYGDYYRRQKDMAKPHTLYVKDVIDNGIKKTISGHPDKREFVEKVVLRHGIKETWGYDKQPQIRIDNVIENGIRPTSKM
jgi:hypothetical protein